MTNLERFEKYAKENDLGEIYEQLKTIVYWVEQFPRIIYVSEHFLGGKICCDYLHNKGFLGKIQKPFYEYHGVQYYKDFFHHPDTPVDQLKD